MGQYEEGEDNTNILKKGTGTAKAIVVICFFLFLFAITTFPHMKIDNSHSKIEYGEKYQGNDYQASNLFVNLKSKVKISDNIDVQKVGKYQVKYQVKYLFWNKTVTKDIEVIDSVKPELTLENEEAIRMCPKTDIKNYNFHYKATDNYDGDITDKVEITEVNNKAIFKVADSSKNETIKEKNIIREDKEKPSIVLKGHKVVRLKVGGSYQEEGYTATDNCDGNLTDKVKIKNNVNYKKSGIYQIEYSVTDSSNQTTKTIRKIIISEKGATSGGIIYLTFDDGPSKSITPKLLDILKEEKVKATFFVINHNSSLDYLIKREYDEGHTVALHSYTHNYKTVYSSKEAYFNDLKKIGDKVKRITGKESKIIRFPGGSSNTVSRRYQKRIMSYLVKEVQKRGYRYYDWNVSSGDAGDVYTKQAVYQSVISGLSHNKNNVVLMHDYENNTKTLNAIRDIIHYGKANGYKFAVIDETTPQIKHGVNN